MKRCNWAHSPILEEYHDHVWGVETHDEQQLFKMLILEGLQAGLSWETILKKESAYEAALDDFDYQIISQYTQEKIDSLLKEPLLIKNKLKMRMIVNNAQIFIKIQEEYGSFDYFIWRYTENKQIKHHYATSKDVPSFDDLSTKISKDLKDKGMSFVGPTIIYSYLQAIGIYNDHETTCSLYKS